MARSRCCYVDTPSGTERSPLILSGWQRAIGADSGQTEHIRSSFGKIREPLQETNVRCDAGVELNVHFV